MSASSESTTANNKNVKYDETKRFQFPKKLLDNNKNKYFIDISEFEISNSPKKGSIGITNFITKVATKKQYVAKTSYQECNPQHFYYILREISSLIQINHLTIMPIEGFSYEDFDRNNKVTIIMDYMENGSLADLLQKGVQSNFPSEYNNTKRQIILIGVSYAMMILHKKNITHKNLKSSNVLLDNSYHPLVTDINLSKIFNPLNIVDKSSLKIKNLYYTAPEVVKYNRYSQKSDVYSFGILMYEVLSGKFAYDDDGNYTEFLKKVTKEEIRPKLDFPLKNGFQLLIEKCWSKNPRERPTFEEIFCKLSMTENLEISEIEDENDYFSFKNYCLDDVDYEELFGYVDSIMKYDEKDREIILLEKKIDEMIKVTIPQKLEEKSQLEKELSLLEDKYEEMLHPEMADETNLEKQCLELRNKVDNDELTEVELPRFLKKIPDNLFKDCTKLKGIKFPLSVTKIGFYSFEGCSSLTSIDLPSTLNDIGLSAFNDCSSLTSIVIPSSVKDISYSSFKNCKSLTNVEIPSSVVKIGNSAFYGCSSLKNFSIPPNVKIIGSSAFYECSSLTSIEIPNKVEKIEEQTFNGCSSLLSVIIPSSVKSIGYSSFAKCSSLLILELPSSITEISESSFVECSSLKSVEFRSSTTKISEQVFRDCSSLTKIILPSSLEFISGSLLENCNSLTEITIPSTNLSVPG